MRGSDAITPLSHSHHVERNGMRLHSAFQPIISVVHSKIVGHEALLRGQSADATPLHPAEMFPRLQERCTPEEIHELCSRLHLQTFSYLNQDGWLFLNVNPDSIVDRRHVRDNFGRWLRESGLAPSRVVVEIIETRACDTRTLTEAVEGFRDLGCLVAIDDFGAGESNFERVWSLQPDIVKLDRAMITEAVTNPLVNRILPGLVNLVHEVGCLVVMEGIETEHQAMIAVESDVDFVQGYYFSHPEVHPGDGAHIVDMFDALSASMEVTQAERNANSRSYISHYVERFCACIDALTVGDSLETSCWDFVHLEGIQRIYELNEQGFQIGRNLEAKARTILDERYRPCADGRGANWSRRPYFQRAVATPGRVQVSRPYLSIADARTCVTISMAFRDKGKIRVLCADIDHPASHPNLESGARFSAIVRR
jgi:EAL domain-containing protein (putative c-di-GMP-specific phosphodiesterase class I)